LFYQQGTRFESPKFKDGESSKRRTRKSKETNGSIFSREKREREEK